MSKRLVRANHEAVRDALDQLEGHPSPPTHRGSQCPPAPFGQTVTESLLYEDGTGPYVVLAEAVLDRHHGEMANGVTIRRDLGVPLPDAVPVDVEPGRGARR